MGWRTAVQALFSAIYFTLIIISVPLAFDVGGVDCGIAFTFTLTVFYLVLSTIRILTRKSRLSFVGSILYHAQNVIIPSLLILHLSYFSNPQPSPLWLRILGPWRAFVSNATPLFTTLEGFCTLLVIQATGHIARRLVSRSDTWMFVQILLSSTMITISLYFLYRIYTFPIVLDLASATLIGAVLTVASLVSLYGIVSGRGSAIESSQIVSYVVYCLYLTFTDFQSSITDSGSILSFLLEPFHQSSSATGTALASSVVSAAAAAATSGAALWGFARLFGVEQPQEVLRPGDQHPAAIHGNPYQLPRRPLGVQTQNFPPLPPIIITGYTNLATTIAESIPQGFITIFEFFRGAFSTISPSVVVSLAYRLLVFYAATRIIPALQREGPPGRPRSKTRSLMFILYSYAPCIIIAVYTHLLMHHFGIFDRSAVGGRPSQYSGFHGVIERVFVDPQLSWQIWGWINMFVTIALYWMELLYGKQSSGDQLMENHFKQD